MTQISREYAIALFTLGKETDTEEEIYNSLEICEKVFQENPEYLELLSSPSIPKAERLKAIGELLDGNVHEYVSSFVSLLCERGRMQEFENCVEDYKSFFQILKEISVAKVESAVALSDEEKETLQKKLEAICGHGVQLECRENKDLIGGMVVEMDGKVYDGSLRQYLSDIKEVMCK